jgi:hypothetical protein
LFEVMSKTGRCWATISSLDLDNHHRRRAPFQYIATLAADLLERIPPLALYLRGENFDRYVGQIIRQRSARRLPALVGRHLDLLGCCRRLLLLARFAEQHLQCALGVAPREMPGIIGLHLSTKASRRV